jgi:hypothetical protein
MSAVRDDTFLVQADEDSVGIAYDLTPDRRRLVATFSAFPRPNRDVRPFAFVGMLNFDVKVAFLRDRYDAWYHRGVVGIGDSIDEVADFLRDFRRHADEIVMIGGSSGAYAAMLFGSLVSCEVHAFSPQTFLDPELRRVHHDERFPDEIAALAPHLDMRYADLRPVVAGSRARVHVYYGTGHPLDRLHAERLGGLDNVTLHGFDWHSHLLLRELRNRGWLRSFLEDLAQGART